MNPIDDLTLPHRTKKPRTTGITEIMDIGTPTGLFKDYLTDFHHCIDFIKFGIGSALITPNLTEKIALAKQFQIEVWFGGTLFEKFYSQNQLNAYIDFLHQNNISWVEISSGTLEQKPEAILRCVETLKKDFHVIAEVGSKDIKRIMSPSQWVTEIKDLLALNCDYVILEGRETATAGMYRQTGEIREGLIADIILQVDQHRLIFETPTTTSQYHFIRQFGANVNLGNIKLEDILKLESQRQALRSETFFIT
jgi:phosphosulfolactate synthase